MNSKYETLKHLFSDPNFVFLGFLGRFRHCNFNIFLSLVNYGDRSKFPPLPPAPTIKKFLTALVRVSDNGLH